ncbi:ATP synthase F1 subunit epsilon [bacterium]|nr:ATP synthase F1 subunit epsilon [bacterium]
MIEVDIVTPSRRVLEGLTVDRVSLPTASGTITVLPGHAELVTLLSTGVLTLPEDAKERRFAISYGFSIVRKNKVIVLAETCEESSEIDLDRAKAAQKKAEQALTGVLTEGDARKQQLKLQRSIIRQQVAH